MVPPPDDVHDSTRRARDSASDCAQADADGHGRLVNPLGTFQYPGNRHDGIPVAGCGRDTKKPVERAKVADDLHVPAVQPEDEAIVSRKDLQQPFTVRGKTHGRGA